MEEKMNIENIKVNITDEQYQQAFEDLAEYELEERVKMLSAYKRVLAEINYPSFKMKEYLRDCQTWHIGFCHVYEEKNYHSSSYPDYKFYSVDKEENKNFHLPNLLMRQDDNKEDSFHCLVWQACCCEDCYSGYLLFPLIGGEYWVVRFEC